MKNNNKLKEQLASSVGKLDYIKLLCACGVSQGAKMSKVIDSLNDISINALLQNGEFICELLDGHVNMTQILQAISGVVCDSESLIDITNQLSEVIRSANFQVKDSEGNILNERFSDCLKEYSHKLEESEHESLEEH